jgi:hypothetical protein
MATKITDRHCPVHFYDVIVSSRAAKGYKVSSPTCAPIGALLSVALGAKAKGHVLNPHAKVVMKSLDDFGGLSNFSNGYALLLNCADLSKPDPRFKHFKTKALRAAGKQSIEAVTKSCHALLLPDATTPNKALLVMTMRNGIQAEDVADFLTQLCQLASAAPRNGSAFAFKDPSGAKDAQGNFLQYRVNYKFDILAHKSQLLDEALRTGVFKEMTLIGHQMFGFDQSGNLQADQQTLTVKSTSPAPLSFGSIKNSIRQYLKGSKQSFDQLRVSYTTRSGQDQSTTMQLNQLDESFTKRENIVLDVNTPDCFAKLDSGIIDSLQELLTAPEND